MLFSAHIDIDRHLRIRQIGSINLVIISRIEISEKIPGGIEEGVERVRLSAGGVATAEIRHIFCLKIAEKFRKKILK